MQSRKVLLTSLPELLSRSLSLHLPLSLRTHWGSLCPWLMSCSCLGFTREWVCLTMEKRNHLPVSDHGLEQVLWGTGCCHTMVVPEQGAGAVEQRSESRCIAFLQLDLLLSKTWSSKCQSKSDILDNKPSLPCLPVYSTILWPSQLNWIFISCSDNLLYCILFFSFTWTCLLNMSNWPSSGLSSPEKKLWRHLEKVNKTSVSIVKCMYDKTCSYLFNPPHLELCLNRPLFVHLVIWMLGFFRV